MGDEPSTLGTWLLVLNLIGGAAGVIGSILLAVTPWRDLKNRRFWDILSKLRTQDRLLPEISARLRDDLLDGILGGYKANRWFTALGMTLLLLAFACLLGSSVLQAIQ